MGLPRPGTEEWAALERAAAAGDPAARKRFGVAKLVAKHALPEREVIAADVAPYRDLAPEERWRHVVAAGQLVAVWLAAMSETDRERALSVREPPHPSYWRILERLRARARAEGA